MSQISKRVVAVGGWDNRQPIDSDVAAQIELVLSNGLYVAKSVTVSRLVQATMTAPNAGSNQIIIELLVPNGTLDATITSLVTATILGLNLPTVASITVSSVTIF
jgi:hypothetical protein